MEELIGRIVSSVGIDEALANKAVGIILSFLNSEGDSGVVGQIMDAIPGAQDAIAAASGGGGGGGLMGALGGLMGGGGGLMGAASQLMGAGLEMGQIQGVSQELIGFAKEKAGDELVGKLVESIPGLDQFS